MEEIDELFPQFVDLPHLHIVGLMGLPPQEESDAERSRRFEDLGRFRQHLQGRWGHPLPELSIGMSDDFELAIHHGATWIRLGSILFGPRKTADNSSGEDLPGAKIND